MGKISVINLGKAYKQYSSRWSRIIEWFTLKTRSRHNLKWVLKDVNFTVNPGEAVGIIGINGAGKSTLLKMITGTTQPTTGAVQINGSVAALLELGMGFHPDFTGRQNALMAGQLLGYSPDQIKELMPEIEAFAEIGEYIDQPVRVYSSGMQVRLAFAVSTAGRPDVLIIDEALSVGDAAFQRKCFQRIESYRSAGTTLLFVSHEIEAIKRLCDKAIFIHQGKVEALGDAKSVCDSYEQVLFGKNGKYNNSNNSTNPAPTIDTSLCSTLIEKQYGDGSAEISDVSLNSEAGQPINIIREGSLFYVNYLVTFRNSAQGAEFGMMIKTVDGVCIYGVNTHKQPFMKDYHEGDKVRVSFKLHANLTPGIYYLNVGATRTDKDQSIQMHRRVDTTIFRVTEAHTHTSLGHANMFALSNVKILDSNIIRTDQP